MSLGAGTRSAVITLVEHTSRVLILQRVSCDHTAPTGPPGPGHGPTAGPAATGRWPGTRAPRWPATPSSAWPPASRCSSAIPRSPWQRGSNENTNGLLRQYPPKGTSPSTHTRPDLDNIAFLLNDRPRQTLEFAKPKEILDKLLAEAGEALTS